jgi:hypothetical protein
MSDVFRKINKETVDHIKYRNTVMTGEVTAVNSDGTYNVKIAQAGSAYPDVETLDYNANFSVGEVVDIAFEYGNRELPKIMGTAKKIAQEPSVVEVDYSSGTGGGKQRITTEIDLYYGGCVQTSCGNMNNTNYTTVHNQQTGNQDSLDLQIGNNQIYIENWKNSIYSTYCIARSFAFFETFNIPTDATITSAYLSFLADYTSLTYEDSDDFSIVVQNGQPNYPHNPLVIGDYYYKHYSNNGGEILASNVSTENWNQLPLNSNGKAWINIGGITKICLRIDRDIAAIVPTNNNGTYIYITDIKLMITYEI